MPSNFIHAPGLLSEKVMCKFIQIIQDKQGYVAQCAYCNALEVVMGTTIIHLWYDQWRSFLHYIQQVKQMQLQKDPDVKMILLDVAGTDFFQMYLTTSELHAFCLILEKADDELKARQLMKCFNHP